MKTNLFHNTTAAIGMALAFILTPISPSLLADIPTVPGVPVTDTTGTAAYALDSGSLGEISAALYPTFTGTGTLQNKAIDATNTIDGGGLLSGSVTPGSLLNLITPSAMTIGNGRISFLAQGLIGSFVPPTNLLLTTSTLSGAQVTGTVPAASWSWTAVTSSTAWSLGQRLISIEQIPGFSTSGTNCATLINSYFGGYIHDVHLLADQSFAVETPLMTGDNTWLEIAPGVTIQSANGENGPVVQNAHQTFVNLSGSANTVSPLVSATSPLFGDQNIMITGAGMRSSVLDNNRSGQTTISRPGYAYTVTGSGASAVVGTRCVFVADFSGVNNLVLSDFGMTNQTVFALTIGNCQHVLKRSLQAFKPTLSATNSYNWSRDDAFHDDGSVWFERTENCYAIDNSDNSFCWNPGDYWTCSPNGYSSALVIGGTNPSPYWTCKWANIGPDMDITTPGPCYTNAQGPGWYELSSTNPAINSDIEHSHFDHFILDAPNPLRGEFVQTVSFIGSLTDVGFDDWFISPLRTAGYMNFNVAFATWNGVKFSRWMCPGFADNGSFFGFSAGYYNNVSIEDCNITGTGGPAQDLCYFSASGSPSGMTGLFVSNNVLTGMGSVLGLNGGPGVGIQNLGGNGNLIVSPAAGADMLFLNPGTAFPANLSGQMSKNFAQQSAESYAGTCFMSGSLSTPVNSSSLSPWFQMLFSYESFYDSENQDFISTQNNQSTTAPTGFGGLWGNGTPTGSFTSSGTNGAYFASGDSLRYPLPAELTGTGSLSMFCIESIPSSPAGDSNGLPFFGVQNGGNRGMALEHYSGNANPTGYAWFWNGSGGQTVLSISGTIPINHPIAYTLIYDGTNGGYLRVTDLAGVLDSSTTATVGSVRPFYGNYIGMHWRQDMGAAAYPSTIAYQSITSGSMTLAEQNSRIATFKQSIGAGFFPQPGAPLAFPFTLSSGTAAVTSAYLVNANPWPSVTATSGTVGLLSVSVSGSTATIHSTSAADNSAGVLHTLANQ